jgi:hypothetical protein
MKKTILFAIAAAASIAAAAPALAQPFQHGQMIMRPPIVETRFAANVDQRIGDLDMRIDFQQRRGQIGRRDAQRLRTELTQIRFMEQRFRMRDRGGFLTGWQSAQLNGRLDDVAAQLRGGWR